MKDCEDRAASIQNSQPGMSPSARGVAARGCKPKFIGAGDLTAFFRDGGSWGKLENSYFRGHSHQRWGRVKNNLSEEEVLRGDV